MSDYHDEPDHDREDVVADHLSDHAAHAADEPTSQEEVDGVEDVQDMDARSAADGRPTPAPAPALAGAPAASTPHDATALWLKRQTQRLRRSAAVQRRAAAREERFAAAVAAQERRRAEEERVAGARRAEAETQTRLRARGTADGTKTAEAALLARQYAWQRAADTDAALWRVSPVFFFYLVCSRWVSSSLCSSCSSLTHPLR